jgi:hypothetical protein
MEEDAMGIVNRQSLGVTLDRLVDADFRGARLLKTDKLEAAKWIAARQGQPRSYAGMFAPTARDFSNGIRLYTGERMNSGAGVSHILGEEACRALIKLNAGGRAVRDALGHATEGMWQRLAESEGVPGFYCCGTCTAALWRHLAAGGLKNQERLLNSGVKHLKTLRQDNGRWRRFPFYYTLLALSEIDLPAARRELKYAGPACERVVGRKATDSYAERRKLVAERVLGMA